jgi:tRNA G26 N,N-dimethylase Trm1
MEGEGQLKKSVEKESPKEIVGQNDNNKMESEGEDHEMKGNKQHEGQKDDGKEQVKFIKEGKAQINIKIVKQKDACTLEEQEVFYNPVQVLNRDLTVLVFQSYINQLSENDPNFEGVTILDALSASGLRAIRFSKELQNVKKVFANDISHYAINQIRENIKLNEIDEAKVQLTQDDANLLMIRASTHAKDQKKSMTDPDFIPKFDIIDLDPYGSAVPFLDAAIQAIKSDGMQPSSGFPSKIYRINWYNFHRFASSKWT